MPLRRASAASLAIALLGAVAACEYDRTTIAQGGRRLAVHAVLNPGFGNAAVLVEHVLAGRITVRQSQSFDSEDPIVSGGGDPVRGARVVLYGPGPTDSAVAVEGATTGPIGRGAGVYRVSTSPVPCAPHLTDCLTLIPGGRYRLRVASGGQVVEGETTLPLEEPLRTRRLPQDFDREGEPLPLAWSPAEGARRYALRIGGPRGPFSVFLADTAYEISGALRNPLEQSLPSVFMPGFVQEVTVAAVDSNYYDYYRSSNDPFTGTGLINRLRGGIGVFGSWVLVAQRTLHVVAPVDDPLEGRYGRATSGYFPPIVHVWVESRDRGTTYVSGRYVNDGEANSRGLVGLLAGRSVTLVFLEDQLASDTAEVFRGELQDDGSIVGDVPGRGIQRLVKLP